MPIRVQCPCGKTFGAPDPYAGKKVKCPQCQQGVLVPTAKVSAVSTSSKGEKGTNSQGVPPKLPVPPRSADIGSRSDPRHTPSTQTTTDRIKVTCQCGQAFAVAGNLAGKGVRCPKCKEPVRIPKKPVSPTVARSTRPPQVDDSVHDLFDEIGVGSRELGPGRRCPECKASMTEEAIICIDCGYNERLGRKMSVERPVTQADRDAQAEKKYAAGAVRMGPVAERVSLPLASQSKRFLNMIIDNFATYFISTAGSSVLASGLNSTPGDVSSHGLAIILAPVLFGAVLALLYYVVMEAAFQKTIGKMVTGTIVVNSKGQRPSIGQILGRTLARLIPFEAFTFFFGNPPVGWHDSLSGTRVINR